MELWPVTLSGGWWRTMAQQLGPSVEAATSPFQYALSTRAGGECVAHALQGICEVDSTILSIDGISAFDMVSRAAMLDGLYTLVGGEALPFVRMFYGAPSSYMWEDAEGVEHTIWQGEGGEQGDALMLLLFSFGQHTALAEAQDELEEGEFPFAILDDICGAIPWPDRLVAVCASLQEHLQLCARIRIHGGKTQVWNSAGVSTAALSASHKLPTPMLEGVVGQERQICLQLSRGSLYWAHHWVTRQLSRVIWRRWQSMPGCTTTERELFVPHFAHKPGARSRHQKCSEFAPCPWRMRGAQRVTSVCGCVLGKLGRLPAHDPGVGQTPLSWVQRQFPPEHSPVTWDLNLCHGAPLLMELVQNLRNHMSLSQESHVKGGSTKQRPESKDISGIECSSVVWRLVSVLWFGRKLVQEQVSLSQSLLLLI